jgi:hypothetical protein
MDPDLEQLAKNLEKIRWKLQKTYWERLLKKH